MNVLALKEEALKILQRLEPYSLIQEKTNNTPNKEETAVYVRAPLPSLILTLELEIGGIKGTSSVLEGSALTWE